MQRNRQPTKKQTMFVSMVSYGSSNSDKHPSLLLLRESGKLLLYPIRNHSFSLGFLEPDYQAQLGPAVRQSHCMAFCFPSIKPLTTNQYEPSKAKSLPDLRLLTAKDACHSFGAVRTGIWL
jgi:hypothetical protein